MNELPGLPPVSVDQGASASVLDPTEDLEGDMDREQAFDDALADSGDLHESQTPETRRAIKGSLDRLPGRQGVHAQPGQAASKEPPDPPAPDGRAKAGGAERSVASNAGHHGPVEKPVASPAGHGELVEEPNAGFARARVPETASSRTGSGSPARAAAAGQPSAHDADSMAAASTAALAPADDAGPASRQLPVDSARRGASDGSAPENAALGVRGQENSRSEGKPLPGSPDARPQGDQPRRASPSEDRTQSGGEGEAPTARESSETKAREPDEAGQPDAQPADLTGLATHASVPEPAGVATPEAAPVSAPRAAELAGEVADRILVSAPEPGTSGEVRISLNESVLDGSDVRIFREAGELRIVFLTRTEAAGQFLADNGTVLQQALGERLGDERVRVEVEPPTGTETGADQQDNEGRSRQRYVAPDDQTASD